MRNIIIIGHGGFGRETKWLVERINSESPEWQILGFADRNKNDAEIVCSIEELANWDDEISVAIAIGDSDARHRIYNLLKQNKNITFPNLVDPSAIIGSDSIGFGNIICAGAIITVNVTLGNFNIVNLDCTIGHDAVLEDYVTLNPSVNVSGNVTIEPRSNIGTGTQIIQGYSVGEGSIVGAGAVVNSNIPSCSVAVGVPAKVIKKR